MVIFKPFDLVNTTWLARFGTNYMIETDNKERVLFLVPASTGYYSFNEYRTLLGYYGSTSTLSASVACYQSANWYSSWSGLTDNLIHCVYVDANSDVMYVNFNNVTRAVSTPTTVFNGASHGANGSLSVTVGRGGYIYVMYDIDGGTEHGFAVSTNNGATWASKTTATEGASGDMFILLPGFAADDDDIICIYWDASANEISRKLYDYSANSWAETSISGSMVETAASSSYPHFSAAVDLTNSQIILTAWSAVDTLNADLKCWTITEGAITAKTDVVTNSTDDQGLCAISIKTDTNEWYCIYCGKSDGSETFNTSVKLYFKISADAGTTWGDETVLYGSLWTYYHISHAMRFTSFPCLSFIRNGYNMSFFHDVTMRKATYQLGI